MRRYYKAMTLVFAFLFCFSLMPAQIAGASVDEQTLADHSVVEDDHVTLEKYAVMVPGTDEREYDITLVVTGKTHTTTSAKPIDLILVLDQSSSMSGKTTTLRNAANGVIAQVLGDNGSKTELKKNRVAVVTYSTSASVLQNFTTNPAYQIGSLSANGYTNMEDALLTANGRVAWANSDNASTGRNATVAVLFMTDGLPTRRETSNPSVPAGDPYAGFVIEQYSGHTHSSYWVDLDWSTRPTYAEFISMYDNVDDLRGFKNGSWDNDVRWNEINSESKYNSYTEFSGGEGRVFVGSTIYRCAECEANFNASHNAGATLKGTLGGNGLLVTVGLFASMSANDINLGTTLLSNISTGGDNFYTTTDPAEIAELFNQSLTTMTAAATDAVVTDQVPAGFSVVAGAQYQPTLDGSRRFTWNIGELFSQEVETYTYRIRANTDVFGSRLPTNTVATLDYVFDEDDLTLDFAVPLVTLPEPGLAIEKTITNGATVAQLGSTIAYSVVVSNPGTLTVHNVTVTDQMLGYPAATFETAPFDLAPGASQTVNYTITIDTAMANLLSAQGVMQNTATATAPGASNYKSQDLTASDTVSLPLCFKYPIEITKVDAADPTLKLAGAVFGIYSDPGATNEIEQVTTGANGVATSGELAAGTYYVKEISAPNGYNPDPDIHTVTIVNGQPGGKATLTVENARISYPIKLIKRDDVNNEPLAGAVFGVYAEQTLGSFIAELPATDDQGQALSTELFAPGTYYLREITAPAGYAINTNWYTAVVTVGGGTAEVTAYNDRVPYPIQITKQDAADGSKLAGATFAIYDTDPAVGSPAPIESVTSGADGIATSAAVAPGTYYVQETAVPAGYELNTTVFTVTVAVNQADGMAKLTVDNARTQYPILITKVDGVSGAFLNGAVFGLYDDDDPSAELLETLPATVNGQAMSQKTYAPGVYYVREITAPAGYVLDTSYYAITVSVNQPGGVAIRANIVNARTPYPIEITKQDAVDGSKLAGATFAVYDADPGLDDTLIPIQTVTSGADGVATTTPLAPGTYYVQETAVPNGYELNDTVYPVTVNVNQQSAKAMLTVENTRTAYHIQVTKKDRINSALLAGAVFGIYKSQPGDPLLLEQITTGADGVAISSDTYEPADYTYYVREITAPAGYELDTAWYIANVTIGGGTVNVEIYDKRLPYPIRIMKLDDVSGEPLAGAGFKVYQMVLGEYVQVPGTTTYLSGADGIAVTDDLAPADYFVKEVSVPAGYELDDTYHPVTVNVNQVNGYAELTVRDDRTPYPIRIYKVDGADNSPLAGAVFGIYDDDDIATATLLETLPATDAGGYAQSTKTFAPGTYYVREITAPAGYEMDYTFYPVTVNVNQAQGVATRADIPNVRTAYPIGVTKLDGVSEAPLAGAVFGIYDGNGAGATLLEELYPTDASGYMESQQIYAPGTYYVKEITAPAGYVLDTAFYPVTVNINQNGGKATITRYNDRTPYPIRVVKLDAVDESPLAGAVFGIYMDDEPGTPAEEMMTTGLDGTATSVGNYAPGTYYVHEITAPAGYEPNPNYYPVVVTINQAGGVAEIRFDNDRTPYPIQVVKLDDVSGLPLEGATFGIYDVNLPASVALELVTTGPDGTATSAKAYAPGTYYVKETAVPAGYELDESWHTVVVTIGGGTQVVTVRNDRTPYPIGLYKLDAVDETPLAGAVYGLYDGNDDEASLLEELPATDGTGYAQTVKGYAPGTYYVREITAPAGYELDPDYHEVTVDIAQQGGVAVLTVTDGRTPYPIGVLKLDGVDATPLAGVVFALYDGNSDGAAMLEELPATDENGLAQTADSYAPGTYYLKEVSVPAGYDLDPTFYEVTVAINQPDGLARITVDNARTPYRIKIVKVDADTQAPLAGAVFGIYQNDELVETLPATDADGLTQSGLLPPGEYTVKEISAPDGYEPNNTVYPVTLTVGGGDQTLVIDNEKTPVPTSTPIDIVETEPPEGPVTGQESSAMPMLLAGLLLAAAALLVVFNHRRRKVAQ